MIDTSETVQLHPYADELPAAPYLLSIRGRVEAVADSQIFFSAFSRKARPDSITIAKHFSQKSVFCPTLVAGREGRGCGETMGGMVVDWTVTANSDPEV